MQLMPDWSKLMPASEIEATFELSFHGPGIYLTDIDTLVITPNPPNGITSLTEKNVWEQEAYWPEGTLYWAHVYNSPIQQTLLGVLAVAPIHDLTTFGKSRSRNIPLEAQRDDDHSNH